ncbi:glycine receptor subunit alpha-3-like [Branchiostoma floridae x Branchiostoma belcheri]
MWSLATLLRLSCDMAFWCIIIWLFFISQVYADRGSTGNQTGESNGPTVLEKNTFIVPGDYNHTTRPGTPGVLLDVNCTAFIWKLGPFSDKDMNFYISFVLLCGWKDERLPSTNQSVIVDESNKKIWRPAIWPMVHAEKLKHEDLLYPILHPGSMVYLMQRFEFRVPCLMQLYTYPHDRQMCGLILGFVGGIKVRWESSVYFQSESESPVIISMPNVRSVFQVDQVDFNSFTLNVQSYGDTCIYQSGSCDYSGSTDCIKTGYKCFQAENINTTTCLNCLQMGGKCKKQDHHCSPSLNKVNLVGDFHTTLELRFALSRSLSFQILHTYVPSFCVVAISWVSFWLDPASAPARTSLGITTVLTMVTLSTKVKPAPELNYIRAIDIWVIGCKIFVVLALLEYAVVNFAARQSSKAPKIPERTADEGEVDESFVPNEESLDGTSDFQLPRITFRGYQMAKKLDYVSRFLFPAAYIAFVASYFGVFVSSDQV